MEIKFRIVSFFVDKNLRGGGFTKIIMDKELLRKGNF